MTLHAQGFLSDAVPGCWLQEQDLFVCPNFQQLVANSNHSSHLRKCLHASAPSPVQSFSMFKGPTLLFPCLNPFFLPQIVEAAITTLCLSVIYAPNGPKVSSVHYGIEHPIIIPLVSNPPLTANLQQSRQQSL